MGHIVVFIFPFVCQLYRYHKITLLCFDLLPSNSSLSSSLLLLRWILLLSFVTKFVSDLKPNPNLFCRSSVVRLSPIVYEIVNKLFTISVMRLFLMGMQMKNPVITDCVTLPCLRILQHLIKPEHNKKVRLLS